MEKRSLWENIRESLGFGNHKRRRKKDCCSAKCGKGRSFKIEPLEERALLSVCTWDGGGSDNNWSTAANWANDVAPIANDSLVFSGSTRTATTNDYTSGTSFDSIEFAADDFSLAGNAVMLTGDVTVETGVSGSTISLAATLSGSVTFQIATGETLIVSSILSGSGNLTKTGDGTLILSGSNTYTSATTISAGTLQLGVNNALPIGTAVTFGTDSTNGVMELNGFNQQVGGLAVASGATAASQVIGNSSTTSDATLTFSSTNSSIFDGTIKDKLTGTGTHATSLVISCGSLTLTGDNTFSGGTTINRGLSQWASSAIAWSSQHGSSNWSAAQAVGAPNVSAYGDNSKAWTPSTQNNSTPEYLTLGYATPVYASGVTIRESCGNGFVTKVEVRNASTSAFETVWIGMDISTPNTLADFSVSFAQRSYLVDAVRITIDTNRSTSSWEEIDAVSLLYSPGELITVQDSAAGTGAITLAGGVLKGAGELANQIVATSSTSSRITVADDIGTSLALSGNISGAGGITYSNDNGGSLELGGDNSSFTGSFSQSGASSITRFASAIAGSASAAWAIADGILANSVVGTQTICLGSLVGNGTLRNDATSGTATFQVGNTNKSTTFTGTIVDGTGSVTVALAKAGSGTLILTGSNTYSGGTIISAGTLKIGDGGVSGIIGGGTITNSGSLVFNRSDSVTLTNSIGGTGSITKYGGGMLSLTAANTYTGSTTIEAGTVSFVSGGFGTSGTIVLHCDTTIQWMEDNLDDISSRLRPSSNIDIVFDTGDNTVTLASTINCTFGSVSKVGDGTLIVSSLIQANDAITINAGTLQFGSGGTSGSWYTPNGFVNYGILAFNRSNNIESGTLITGTGSVSQRGTGVLALTNANNSYTGGTNIEGGTLAFATGALGTTGAITFIENGAIQWGWSYNYPTNTQDISNRIVINDGVNATFITNKNNVVLATGFGNNGTGAVTKIGTGTLTLNGANTYTGRTTFTIGTLVLGTANALAGDVSLSSGTTVSFVSSSFGGNSNIEISGGVTLQWADGNVDDISDRLLLNNGATATFNIGSNDITFATVFGGNGTGKIVKNGSGALSLTVANTYTGGTTINDGTIVFVSGGLCASGTIAVKGNSTLRWANGNTDDISGRVSINANVVATMDIGANNVTFASNTNVYGSLAKDGAGTLTIAGTLEPSLGDVTINAGTLQIGIGGTTGSVNIANIINNGSLIFNHSNDVTFNNLISGTGSVSQVGTAMLALRNSGNSYTGGTYIEAGTLAFEVGSLGATGNITFVDDGTLRWGWLYDTGTPNTQDVSSRIVIEDGVNAILDTNGHNISFASEIGNNTASITKTGNGTLTLAAVNTYTVNVTVNAGSLVFNENVTVASDRTFTASNSADMHFAEGLSLAAGGVLALNNSAKVYLMGSTNLSGAGQIILNGSSTVLYVQGVDSSTPATLTIGSSISVCGTGTIDGYYSADNMINQGTIKAEHGTLRIDAPLTNQGSLVAIGTGILTWDGSTIQGSASAISGTELFLYWLGLASDADAYTLQLSDDGGNTYSTVSTTTASDTNYLQDALISDTKYHLRVVASYNSGAAEIYESGSISTLDLPDATARYRVSIANTNSSGPSYSSIMSSASADGASLSAGSSSGAIIGSLQNMVMDGSLPAPDANGQINLYVFQEGLPSPVSSFDSSYPPGAYSQPVVFAIFTILDQFFSSDSACSDDPIRYCDGAVDYSTTDIESDGLGSVLSQSRSWSSNEALSANQNNGTGWIDNSLPTIQQLNDDSAIAIIRSATSGETFELSGGQYIPTIYVADTLVHDTVNGEFVWADTKGNQLHFYDFSNSTPTGRQGQMKSMIDAKGLITEVTAWTANGTIQEVQCRDANSNAVKSWFYSYLSSSDPNAGLLSSVQLRESDGNGGWMVVKQVVYDYYTGTYTGDDLYGNLNDLKSATVKDANSNVLSTEYYRYYTSDTTGGYVHGLKYVFDAASYARLSAVVGNPFTATNSQVSPYAQHYFEYDGYQRCMQHDIQKVGGTATDGIGVFSYSYSTNPNFNLTNVAYNTWEYKTVETLPDGSVNIVYCNAAGQALFTVGYEDDDSDSEVDANELVAAAYYQYNTLGRLTLKADGLAIASCTVDEDAKTGYTVTLSSSSGEFYLTTYYGSTNATASADGGVKGFVESYSVKQGSTGTPALLETIEYYRKASGGSVYVAVANDTVYFDGTTTTDSVATYAYTWPAVTGVTAPLTAVAYLPDEDTGAQSSDASTAIYDAYGRAVWTKDANGSLTYMAYDDFTGAVVKLIQDVNVNLGGIAGGYDTTYLPAAWATLPALYGEHLTTVYEADSLGRTTKVTDAEGNVMFNVYNDTAHEIRVYTGWRLNTTTGFYYAATNAVVSVYRDDRTNNYTETLAYTWTGTGANALPVSSADGSPLGTESLSSAYVSLQSLSRVLRNSAGQKVAYLEYFYLTGIAYSSTTVRLGSEGVNYYETNYEYGDWGSLAKLTDASGVEARYEYDAQGNITKATQNYVNGTYNALYPDEDVATSYTYDKVGNLISETDASGVETRYEYNYLGQLVETCQNFQNGEHTSADASDEDIVTAYSYDLFGNVLSETDVLNNASTYLYDARGQLYRATDALGNATNYAYDAVGDLVSVTTPDPDGSGGPKTSSITHYTYNGLGQCTSVTLNYQDGVHDSNDDADEDVITAYTYDGLGNVLTLTDSVGNTTEWTYDALGRVETESNEANATSREYDYDDLGRLVEYTDYSGRVTTYEYDALGRETEENWLNSQQTVIYTCEYEYDELGNLLSASDDAATYEYEYDDLGRLTEQTATLADLSPAIVLNYTYNNVGNLTQVAETIGSTTDAVTDYTYDDLGRVMSIQQHGATGGNAVAEKRIDFTYDDAGLYATIVTYANLAGTQLVSTATYAFDDAYELVGLIYTKGATTLSSYAYTYDDAGNMTQMVTVDGTVAYTNDDTGQLTAADYNYQTDESYTYDENGNRVVVDGTTTYVTGDDNRLLSDGTYRYTYDAEGNRTSKFVDADADGVLDSGDTDVTTYSWDYRNRLTEVEHFSTYANYDADTSDQIVEYDYDAFNRLIGRTLDADGAGGATAVEHSVYVYDGDQIASQFDKSGTGDLAATDLSHRYLWNPQAVDQLFADEDVADGQLRYALTDHENSVRDLATYDSGTDITTIANHRVYDSYGNLKSQTNAAVDCLFGYTGRMYDEATGLQNNLNRWYDAKVGRWLSDDPIGFTAGDANLYRYVGNSPTIYVDASGLYGVGTRMAIGAGTGALSGAAAGALSGALVGNWPGALAGLGAGALGGGIAGAISGLMGSRCDSLGSIMSSAAFSGAIAGALSGIPAGLAAGNAAKASQGAMTQSTISNAALVKGSRFFNGFKTGYNQQTQQIGQFTKFSIDVPGKVPGSFTRWVKTVNVNGKTTRLYHDTFDKIGKFIHRGIKVPGPERHVP